MDNLHSHRVCCPKLLQYLSRPAGYMFSLIRATVSLSSRLSICWIIPSPIRALGFSAGLPVAIGTLGLLNLLTSSSPVICLLITTQRFDAFSWFGKGVSNPERASCIELVYWLHNARFLEVFSIVPCTCLPLNFEKYFPISLNSHFLIF